MPDICFIASPISVLDPEFRQHFLESVERISVAIEVKNPDTLVYSASREIGKLSADKTVFEDNEDAHEKNEKNLKDCKWFLMVYPNQQLKSGVIAEVGAASILGKLSILCVRDVKDLPWHLRNGTRTNTVVIYETEDQLERYFAANTLDDIFNARAPGLPLLTGKHRNATPA